MRKSRIHPRKIDEPAKKRIKKMLRHGDVAKISDLCESIGYQQVSNVLNGRSQNDNVWNQALQYIDSLPEVDINERIASAINNKMEIA